MSTYIVVSDKPWVERIFAERKPPLQDHWICTKEPESWLGARPEVRYVFFLYWSQKVPAWITDGFEAINFHMTALPFGRGGSPLQNLIAMGKQETHITAHQMTAEIDAGPIYCQQPMSLHGLAEEIYLRATEICFEMMETIAANEPEPVPQQGEPTYFKRRTPDQSFIQSMPDLKALFDHMRMLDCEGYPRAYLEHQGYRYEFSRPAFRHGRIVADVEIRKER